LAKPPTPDDDLDRVMDAAFGRRFIMDFIVSGLDSDGFSSDPLVLAYNAGKRELARDLERRCKTVCYDKWQLMQREHYREGDDFEGKVRDA
jgi:hypothetical protein